MILCFINLCLGALIARGVSFLLTNVSTGLDSITDELIEQAIVSAVAFILTGWVCIKLLIKNDNITKVGRTSLKEVILPAIFLILFSIPFINQLAVWNSELTLPESLAGLEKLMKEMEDTANAITMQVLERNTTTDELAGVDVLARYASPMLYSLPARTDSAMKIASVDEGFAGTDVFDEMVGFDQATIARVKAQKRSAQAHGTIANAIAALGGRNGNDL